jgi:hypothetical protein
MLYREQSACGGDGVRIRAGLDVGSDARHSENVKDYRVSPAACIDWQKPGVGDVRTGCGAQGRAGTRCKAAIRLLPCVAQVRIGFMFLGAAALELPVDKHIGVRIS